MLDNNGALQILTLYTQFWHVHLGCTYFCCGYLDNNGFMLGGVSGLDINGCGLSYFEGTANLHCYTSCSLTTLHCSKVSFFQCCHMKIYNIFTKVTFVRYNTYCIYNFFHKTSCKDNTCCCSINVYIWSVKIILMGCTNKDFTLNLNQCYSNYVTLSVLEFSWICFKSVKHICFNLVFNFTVNLDQL